MTALRNVVRLVPTTVGHLDLEDISVSELALSLGVGSPTSWPPLYNGPETRQWVRDALLAQPDGATWFSWYVLATIDGVEVLAGICGFKGPPDSDGSVEIGYSIVPELQRLGLATQAVQLLSERAFDAGARMITAETLPSLTPSQRVLLKTGFEHFESYQDPEVGEVWRYRHMRR